MAKLEPRELLKRFAVAALLATVVVNVLGFVLLKTTGVPDTYPPLLPQQLIAGGVGGAFLVTAGYWLLSRFWPNPKTALIIFVAGGLLLMVASYYLPYRLTYTTSPRFAGATVAAQFGQALLHTLVTGISMMCFLRRRPSPINP